MESIKIDTTPGLVRLAINDDQNRIISFNPYDLGFVERFYRLEAEVKAKLEEFHSEAEELDKRGAGTKEGYELYKKICDYMTGIFDEVFGPGTCKTAFGDAKQIPMFAQLLNGVRPYILKARKEKFAIYMTPDDTAVLKE